VRVWALQQNLLGGVLWCGSSSSSSSTGCVCCGYSRAHQCGPLQTCGFQSKEAAKLVKVGLSSWVGGQLCVAMQPGGCVVMAELTTIP
jgi:hypothetical protein